MKSKTVISILAACALLLSGYAHSGGSIASTPAIAETNAAADYNYDMDEYAPSLGDIAGEWIYEEQDAGITDQYVGRPVGRYSISADGTFTYTSDGSSFATGTIGIDYEEYPDGSKAPLFVFYDESGEPFMASYATVPEERTDGCLYIGQDGASRLVPADPAPNEYGFSAFSDPSA